MYQTSSLLFSKYRLEYQNIKCCDIPISPWQTFQCKQIFSMRVISTSFYHTGISLDKPNNKGTLKLHLLARICFSAHSEDRRATVYQRANWFFSWLSAVNEHQQYNACDIFHLLERRECYFVRLSMKELCFSDQPVSLFPLPCHLLIHS